MRVAASVEYSALCAQLGVKAVPGIRNPTGKPIEADTRIPLRSVVVEDDDVVAKLVERDMWNDDPAIADDVAALADFIDALLVGDAALARILGGRVFADERMREACERALTPAPARRAA